MKTVLHKNYIKQLGLSLVELMVSIAIGMTVLSGVVQVLVVSKSNFISERELSMLQENARFAVKFMSDEIRMAGYTGCSSSPLFYANTVTGGDSSWYLANSGLQGYEYDAGINTFPAEFRTSVAARTDAIVVRSGKTESGLAVDSGHNPNSANIPLNKAQSFQKGQILMLTTPDCTQVVILQYTGNSSGTNLNHNTGNANPSPGNCTKNMGGNFNCSSGSSAKTAFGQGSRVMTMSSDAFYVGVSETDSTVPALFREHLKLTGTTLGTQADELVQGVENMQILYGLDNAFGDGVADIYVKANSGLMNWSNVVSVRLTLRMRSINPIYNENVSYPVFENVTGTDGSDRFMRQTVSTTIQIRNS